jgi:quinolinate synthase
MLKHVGEWRKKKFLVLTECGLVSRLQAEFPEKNFVGSCTMCRYMKSNSLQDILRVLVQPRPEDRIVLDEDVRKRALASIETMFRYAEGAVPRRA